MPASDNSSTVIILGVILLLSLYYIFGSGPIPNEGNLQLYKQPVHEIQDEYKGDDSSDSASESETNGSSISENSMASEDSIEVRQDADNASLDDSTDSSIDIIKERSLGRNGSYNRRKNGNKYVHSSYKALGEDKDLSAIDKQFRVMDVSKNETDKFVPSDDGNGNGESEYAQINLTDVKGTDKNKFDTGDFLPKQKEKDWFETIESVSVKNRNLIQIHRPIGVNTVGSSHKGAIYDIRGLDDAIAPKEITGPWLQSSWEPDRSSKRLCS
jgi:hypothetical protein